MDFGKEFALFVLFVQRWRVVMVRSQPKVSVIVAVYNGAQYLAQCLDSLINQTLAEIQIIIVNDGSTDRSASIIEHYCEQFPHRCEQVILSKRSGLSCARNMGMSKAKGEFIGFLDSHCYAHSTMFEKLHYTATSENSDMAFCHLTQASTIAANKHYDRVDISTHYLNVFITNKIFRRSVIEKNKVFFFPNTEFEDQAFNYLISSYANSVAYVEDFLLFYCQKEKISDERHEHLTKMSDMLLLLMKDMEYRGILEKNKSKMLEYIAHHALTSSYSSSAYRDTSAFILFLFDLVKKYNLRDSKKSKPSTYVIQRFYDVSRNPILRFSNYFMVNSSRRMMKLRHNMA